MRLAFVYDAVHPWEKGGAQKRVWELARRLADDHDVHLFGMHYWDGPSSIEREGVTLHGVCEPKELYVEGRRSIPQALTFAAHLTPALLREDFDVVDCQAFPYFPILTSKLHALLRSSTLVVTWYEVWDDYWYEYLGRKGVFGKLVERTTLRLADTVVPISAHVEADLRAIGRTNDLHVVENGVDFDRLQDVPAADADWDIIYVGRLAEHKHVEWLLEAVQLVSERTGAIDCGIIGDGPERTRLERHAAALGLDDQVEFLGFVDEDDTVIAHLKAASIFVLPSTREGFPNTILEANACGVPSIVVDHPENGSTAVVEDGVTGFVTDPDPAAIAERIEVCHSDADLLAELSANAREYGRAHDWDVIVEELERVYSSARRADG